MHNHSVSVKTSFARSAGSFGTELVHGDWMLGKQPQQELRSELDGTGNRRNWNQMELELGDLDFGSQKREKMNG